jgi:hypothetical protein
MPLNDGMHLAGTMEFGGIRLLSCPAEVIRHMQSLVDGRPADHSDGAGTSVNSCTGSKVNEQLFDLTRSETGAAHTLSSSLAAR